MGRELKKVAKGFFWELGKTWEGYTNPYHKYSRDCKHCSGTGHSKEYEVLKNKWYGYSEFNPSEKNSEPFTMDDPEIWEYVKRKVNRNEEVYNFYSLNGRLSDFDTIAYEIDRLCSDCWNNHWSHHLNDEEVKWLWDEGRLRDFKECPTAKELNKKYLFGFGHDSMNSWIVIGNTLKKENKPELCDNCKGEGVIWDSEEQKKQCENWEPYEPPTGNGFQLWEITSEGSPISPVFSDFMELCEWCEDNATTFGSKKTSKENWVKMLGDEFVFHKSGNAIFC